MNSRKLLAALAASLLGAGILALAGCASVSAHLPWRHRAPPPPEVSTALSVATPEGAAVSWPQIWQRNDVVLDMTAVAPSGSAVVAPRAGLAWPVRVALRVTAGAIAVLEVDGAQRVLLPINASAGAPIDLELDPGVYTPRTPQLTVRFGPASGLPQGP